MEKIKNAAVTPIRVRKVKGVLSVSVAKPYGVETIYPECETSRLFCQLLKQKSLTGADVALIKELGYRFIVVPSGGRRSL